MVWLELRKNNENYDAGWNYTESVWAPTAKDNGAQWPFWNLIAQVKKGDIIFHLHYSNNKTRFEGVSTAESDGYITTRLPTRQGHLWDFSKVYHKVDLTDFQPLEPQIDLADFFSINNSALRDYFKKNKRSTLLKKHIFYVLQKGKLQCLNGAYFTEFDEQLSSMLVANIQQLSKKANLNNNVTTGEFFRLLKQRIGHDEFADNVKRNFSFKCCVPKCKVTGRGFLISGHIDRWADNQKLRGNIGNGLCFCLMHDKAFEKGFFTLNERFQVTILHDRFEGYEWLYDDLKKVENFEIKKRIENPLKEAIYQHWARIGYQP
jgi:hypothetical protein